MQAWLGECDSLSTVEETAIEQLGVILTEKKIAMAYSSRKKQKNIPGLRNIQDLSLLVAQLDLRKHGGK